MDLSGRSKPRRPWQGLRIIEEGDMAEAEHHLSPTLAFIPISKVLRAARALFIVKDMDGDDIDIERNDERGVRHVRCEMCHRSGQRGRGGACARRCCGFYHSRGVQEGFDAEVKNAMQDSTRRPLACGHDDIYANDVSAIGVEHEEWVSHAPTHSCGRSRPILVALRTGQPRCSTTALSAYSAMNAFQQQLRPQR